LKTNLKKVTLATAVALALGAGSASAAITTNYGLPAAAAVGGTITVATETVNVIKQNQATSLASGNSLIFTSTAVWGAGSTITLQVNGATFNGAPNQLTADPSGVLALNLAVAGAPTVGTQIGSTQYQWVVGTANAIGDTLEFDLGTIQSTNLVSTSGPVTYTITVNNPPAGGGAAIDATPVTSGAAFNVTSAVTGTALTNGNTVSDVAQLVAGVPFVFNAAGGLANPIGTAGSAWTLSNVTSAQAITAGGLVITLDGNFTGIATVNEAGVTASSATGVATVGAVAGTMTINAARTQATAIITGGLAAGGAFTFNPVLVFDGATQQGPRTFTSSANLIAVGTFNANAPIATTGSASIVSVTNNGMAFSTDLMGTSSPNTVVIRDASNNLPVTGGRIIMTGSTYAGLSAGASAGTAFGPITLSTLLPSGGQVVLTPASIAADAAVVAAGGLPAGAAAKFNFVVETAAGSASEKKQVAGVGLSSQTVQVGGALTLF